MSPNHSDLGPLTDGCRAVIIGGGPGGTSTAISLLRGAHAIGRDIRVTILEGKQFIGEQHHNQCVGVLSPPIENLLQDELCVPFPYHLSRGAIDGYVLHTPRRAITLDGEIEPSLALRRVQFDAYMLNTARQHGVEVIPARATDLEFHAERVVIYTESSPLDADVVVGAFGLDEGMAAIFTRAAGYKPPPALSSVVTKYHPGEEGMNQFGCRIHAFLPAMPRIEFGGITPKGNHLTINIAGAKVNSELMDKFLTQPYVRNVLPCLENAGSFDEKDMSYFKGRFPRGLAHNFTGDRFVLVGDAAGLVRSFKGKGVTTAIQTGIRAAQVMLQEGISASAFQKYLSANHDIIRDLPYGQFTRRLTILLSRFGLMGVILKAGERDADLRRALFNAVSAHRSYGEVIHQAISLNSIKEVLTALVSAS